jgi:hypothetical protein
LSEGYQNNSPPPDRPDEIQYMACHDYSSGSKLGNNNYKLNKHKIGMPLNGTYTTFIDKFNIRNYDEFFHSPICEKYNYNFENINLLEFREIANYEDENINEIYKEEIDLDKYGIKDPNYLYLNPKFIANKILYPESINEKYLMSHKTHETETLQHRMDASLYGNDI